MLARFIVAAWTRCPRTVAAGAVGPSGSSGALRIREWRTSRAGLPQEVSPGSGGVDKRAVVSQDVIDHVAQLIQHRLGEDPLQYVSQGWIPCGARLRPRTW